MENMHKRLLMFKDSKLARPISVRQLTVLPRPVCPLPDLIWISESRHLLLSRRPLLWAVEFLGAPRQCGPPPRCHIIVAEIRDAALTLLQMLNFMRTGESALTESFDGAGPIPRSFDSIADENDKRFETVLSGTRPTRA